MSGGPRRPFREVAIIQSTEVLIDSVDDIVVRDKAGGTTRRFEVLPGLHTLQVSLLASRNYVLFTKTMRSGLVTVCVHAKPGHVYGVRPVITAKRWRPIVVDAHAHVRVSAACGPDDDDEEDEEEDED